MLGIIIILVLWLSVHVTAPSASRPMLLTYVCLFSGLSQSLQCWKPYLTITRVLKLFPDHKPLICFFSFVMSLSHLSFYNLIGSLFLLPIMSDTPFLLIGSLTLLPIMSDTPPPADWLSLSSHLSQVKSHLFI